MATLAPPENALTRVESYQWPSAHVGHLDEHQSNALASFKELCEKKGYYTPATATTPASHDEETLLRYLRARKFVPQDAFGQFKETEDWRAENQLDNLYQTIDVQEYEQTRRLYPQWTGRRDRRGIPFYVYEIQSVDTKDVTATGKDDKKNPSKTPRKMLRLFALYENLCRFVLPFCSAIPNRPNGETPISQSSNVVDLSKVGFTKFWSLRNHMSDASALATAHYPETLDHIFVIGAPSFFPTVWQWAKKWFDPITVSKISILSDKQVFPELSKFVHPDNIPKKYGGNLDWHFGDMPFLEPAIVNAMNWKETTEGRGGHKTLPMGPIKWQYDDKGDLVAMAIGTEHGKPRNRVLAALHPQEGIARLALSPGRLSKEDSRAVAGVGAEPLNQRANGGKSVAPSSNPAPTPNTNTNSSSAAPPPTINVNGTPTAAPPPASTSNAGAIGTAGAAGVVAGGAGLATTARLLGKDPNTTAQQEPQVQPQPQPSTATTSQQQEPFDIPYRTAHNSTEIASPPPDSRQGTSHTRFAQQAGTHAEDQLAHGTPEHVIDSRGEKLGVMEPNTVGQAPKEFPLPDGVGGQQKGMEGNSMHQKGYVEQAEEMLESVLPASVLGAVGLGHHQKSGQEEAVEEKKHDPEIDGMEGKKVEDFLRAKAAGH